jgi:hypothetical protein
MFLCNSPLLWPVKIKGKIKMKSWRHLDESTKQFLQENALYRGENINRFFVDQSDNGRFTVTFQRIKSRIEEISIFDREKNEHRVVELDSDSSRLGRARVFITDNGDVFFKNRGQYLELDKNSAKTELSAWVNPVKAEETVQDGGVAKLSVSDEQIQAVREALKQQKLRANVDKDLVVTDNGEIYLNISNKGVFLFNKDAFSNGHTLIKVPGTGKRTESVITEDGQIVTFGGEKHAFTKMTVTDAATKHVESFDTGRIGNKAGRGDVVLGEDGEIIVKSDNDNYYKFDVKTGAKTELIDVKNDDAFAIEGVINTVKVDGQGASAAVKDMSSDQWVDMTDGLLTATGLTTEQLLIHDIIAKDDNIFATMKVGATSHIMRFDGNSWDSIASTDVYGKFKTLVAGADGVFYVGVHHNILEVDTNTGKMVHIASTIDAESIITKHMQFYHGKLFTVTKDSANNRVVSVYDTKTETWEHLKIDFELDGKPHTDLLIDNDGNIWYKSNYSGIFKADKNDDGSYADFVKVSDRSGAIYLSGGGDVHLSYEVTKHTQIATTFRYNPDAPVGENWEQLFTARGYSLKGAAIDGTSATFTYDSRFGDFIIAGDLKYDAVEMPGMRGKTQNVISTNGVMFADVTVNGQSKLVALDVQNSVNGVVPYNSDLQVENARNLVDEDIESSEATGLEILNNGQIAVGYSSDDEDTFAIYSETGDNMLASFAIGKVSDMDTNPDGSTLVIATDQGVYKYSTANGAMDLIYNGNAGRVDTDASGNIVIANGQRMTVIDGQGDVLLNRVMTGTYFEDIAIDAQSNLVYAVGFRNQTLPGGNPVQGSYLRAYDMTSGSIAWSRFEFPGNQKANNIADARLNNVEIGQNGELYIMGQSAGSQTIFRFDGTRLDGPDILQKIDHANDLWNTASAHILYHAHVDKFSGDIINAQLTMGRLKSNGKSNTYAPGDIAVDENGNVYIGGENAYGIQNREGISINGDNVPRYDGSDPSFMALNDDFSQRYSWHSLDMGGANGRVTQVATRDGKTALLTQYKDGELYLTDGQDANNGGANINLAIIDSGEIYNPDNFSLSFDDVLTSDDSVSSAIANFVSDSGSSDSYVTVSETPPAQGVTLPVASGLELEDLQTVNSATFI